jgi:hypothetical protein
MHTRLVGREGGLGLGSLASPSARVQGAVLAAGQALRVAHSILQEACDHSPLVQAIRIRYCEFVTNYAKPRTGLPQLCANCRLRAMQQTTLLLRAR